MPNPKHRNTSSQRNRRRSHIKLKKQKLFSCPKCGEAILPHHICAFCGYYNGREIIDVLAKLEKKEKKIKAKELKEHEAHAKDEQKKVLNLEQLSRK